MSMTPAARTDRALARRWLGSSATDASTDASAGAFRRRRWRLPAIARHVSSFAVTPKDAPAAALPLEYDSTAAPRRSRRAAFWQLAFMVAMAAGMLVTVLPF